MTGFALELLARDGAARRGRLTTAHGTIETPAFMPVGTAATVKAMTVEQVRGTGAEIILGNVYHLMLRPGAERIARLGGLRRFMRWDGPVLTDSGGYQVMSLAQRRTLREQGVTFSSHLDGSRHELSPERSIEIQHLLGATITMQLDECIKLPAEKAEVARAMELSLRWAERSRAAFVPRPGHALFGIVQGGTDQGLRDLSAEGLCSIGFDGYAVGGLAVGEPQALMLETLDAAVPRLPEDRPRYLMGVGKPMDILGAVARGHRHVRLRAADALRPHRPGLHPVRDDQSQERPSRGRSPPARRRCAGCPATRDYSRAYLHHLVKSGEILGAILLTWNNLFFYQELMRRIRDAVTLGRLAELAAEVAEGEARGDLEPYRA